MSAKLRQFMSKKLVSECITMISSPGMVIHSPNNYVQCFCLHVSMQPRVKTCERYLEIPEHHTE
jgi:hypothetical protein